MKLQEGAAELIEIIDRGGRIREMLRFFERRRDALGYYATRMHFKYDPKSAFYQPCCVCMNAPCMNVVEFRWEAAVFTGVRVGWLDLLAVILFKFTIPRLKFDVINFRTFHPFCHRCWGDVERDRLFAQTIDPLTLGTLLFASIGIIWGVLQLAFGRPRTKYVEAGWCIGVAAVLCGIAWLMSRFARWVRLPNALKHLARRPFRFNGSTVVRDLPAAILAAAAGPEQRFDVEAGEVRREVRSV